MNPLARFLALAWTGGLLCWTAPSALTAEAVLHSLIVGGGPDLPSNGAEIESHLKFVLGMLPKKGSSFVHFTDGKPGSLTVSFTDTAKCSLGERAMAALLPSDGFGAREESREPDLGLKNVAASLGAPIKESFTRLGRLAARAPDPALVYFAGHGSRNASDENNNHFDLWGRQKYYVKSLAADLEHLPRNTPVVLVMVQCYSGAFSNVIFRHGDPENELADRDIAGFFASARDREAAGCGTEVHEPDYQDFSSYFFGALSGRNKEGAGVIGADYDSDGKVSLHEAFCYALINDDSIDTPNCTSDAFLRRFATLPEVKLYAKPYAEILATASPAQKAVLESLSKRLELMGEDRLQVASDRLNFRDPIARKSIQLTGVETSEKMNTLRQEILTPLFAKWPALRWTKSADYDEAAERAVAEMNADAERCRQVLEADAADLRASAALENEEAFLLRFTGVCSNIIRTVHVRANAPAGVKARLEKLLAAEQRTLPVQAP